MSEYINGNSGQVIIDVPIALYAEGRAEGEPEGNGGQGEISLEDPIDMDTSDLVAEFVEWSSIMFPREPPLTTNNQPLLGDARS